MKYKKMQTVLFDGTIIEVSNNDILLLGLNFASAGLMGKLSKLQNIDKSMGCLRTLDFADLTESENNLLFDPNSNVRKRFDDIIREYLGRGIIGIFITSAHVKYPSVKFLKCIEFLKQIVYMACVKSTTPQLVFGSDDKIDFYNLLGEDAKFVLHPKHGIHEFCVDLFLLLPKYENTEESMKI